MEKTRTIEERRLEKKKERKRAQKATQFARKIINAATEASRETVWRQIKARKESKKAKPFIFLDVAEYPVLLDIPELLKDLYSKDSCPNELVVRRMLSKLRKYGRRKNIIIRTIRTEDVNVMFLGSTAAFGNGGGRIGTFGTHGTMEVFLPIGKEEGMPAFIFGFGVRTITVFKVVDDHKEIDWQFECEECFLNLIPNNPQPTDQEQVKMLPAHMCGTSSGYTSKLHAYA